MYYLPKQRVKLSDIYKGSEVSDEAYLEFNRLTEDECFEILTLLENAQKEAEKGIGEFRKRYDKIKEVLKKRYSSGQIESEKGIVELPVEDFVKIFRPADYATIATFLVQ